MNIVGIDSNIVILMAPSISPHVSAIRQHIATVDTLILSTLVISECLVRPLREKNNLELTLFRRFFASPVVRIVDVDEVIARRSAMIRADYNLHLIDAIHLATALEHGASRFLTTDKHFERCIGKLPIDIIRTDP